MVLGASVCDQKYYLPQPLQNITVQQALNDIKI